MGPLTTAALSPIAVLYTLQLHSTVEEYTAVILDSCMDSLRLFAMQKLQCKAK